MSWYDTYKEEWKAIIEMVANETKRSSILIEKDVIQSMFLYHLSKTNFPFVFKGGTSLSKAYRLIDRFSEDIDLSLSKKPTDSEKRKSKEIILEIASKLGMTLYNPETIKSRYDYNKYVFKYESLFNKNRLEIIVETSFYQDVYPVEIHEISSYIGLFCESNNVSLPIHFDAMKFKMNVQSLERTFIDKVFAVCDYRIQNMWDRDSRHLYDIAKIIPHIKFDDSFSTLIKNVRNDRMQSKNNPSAQPSHNINELLFDIIYNDFFESDYNKLTMKLLYEEYDYKKAIEDGIAKVMKLNIF